LPEDQQAPDRDDDDGDKKKSKSASTVIVELAESMYKFGLSDAGAHLTFLCDAGFGLHLLGYWVRERKLMPLQEAIRKITSEPAQIFGIRERGSIKPGMHADLFLFDPQTVGRKRAERVFDLPAGASRLTTPAIGVHGVWINGRKIADAQGIRADAPKAGKVLRDFAS
jgi:N-acyl-D-aspartate/D-glutamate deacylase